MKSTTMLRRVNKAIKRIEQGWTKGVFARDKLATDCDPGDAAAVCWCAAGALAIRKTSVNGVLGDDAVFKQLIHRLANNLPGQDISDNIGKALARISGWNDMQRNKTNVLAMLEQLRAEVLEV